MRLFKSVSLATTISILFPVFVAAQEREPRHTNDQPAPRLRLEPRTTERPTSPVYRIGQVAVVAANLADVHSTLTGWKLGLHEVNPFIGGNDTSKLLTMKATSVGVNLLLMYALKRTGHDKAAGWIGISASALPM